MRLATLTLVTLGLVCLGTTFAVAEDRPANAPAAPLATAADAAVVTPVHGYRYGPAPRWGGYYHYPRYQAYPPRAYWYGPPRYRSYYADPYAGYYYPNTFGFQYSGPRRSFGFAF